jgi:hypothetical protein
MAISSTPPMEAPETLRALLEHRATVRRQRTATLDRSISAGTQSTSFASIGGSPTKISDQYRLPQTCPANKSARNRHNLLLR